MDISTEASELGARGGNPPARGYTPVVAVAQHDIATTARAAPNSAIGYILLPLSRMAASLFRSRMLVIADPTVPSAFSGIQRSPACLLYTSDAADE